MPTTYHLSRRFTLFVLAEPFSSRKQTGACESDNLLDEPIETETGSWSSRQSAKGVLLNMGTRGPLMPLSIDLGWV